MVTIERTLELWNFINTIEPDCDYYHIAISIRPYLSAMTIVNTMKQAVSVGIED